MKKLLLLGGTRYLLPVIRKAHEMGIYVITCDYLPHNIAHNYSDEYRNVSIIDQDAVLAMAKERKIDGILSFGTDPGVVTCAYVAEKMGLPGSPYKSVKILQNKDLFRAFLREHNFNVPKGKGYATKEEALADVDSYKYPIVVKPVDSAGSKGVVRVDSKDTLVSAIDVAFEQSVHGRIIMEEFIQQKGFASDSDSFSIDDELVFASFDNQYFDDRADNPYTPAAYTWPSFMPRDKQIELRNEIARIVKLLHMGTSIYNIETRVGTDGKAYIMECAPRGGGNRLSEMLELITGQDLIGNNIRWALGMPLLPMKDPEYHGIWAEYVLHSYKDGLFRSVKINPDFEKEHIKQKDIWVEKGNEVHVFSGANRAIGTLVMQFDYYEEAEEALAHPERWLTLELDYVNNNRQGGGKQ